MTEEEYYALRNMGHINAALDAIRGILWNDDLDPKIGNDIFKQLVAWHDDLSNKIKVE